MTYGEELYNSLFPEILIIVNVCAVLCRSVILRIADYSLIVSSLQAARAAQKNPPSAALEGQLIYAVILAAQGRSASN